MQLLSTLLQLLAQDESWISLVNRAVESARWVCRGKQIKDIAWFMIVMSVLLLLIGAGTRIESRSPVLCHSAVYESSRP